MPLPSQHLRPVLAGLVAGSLFVGSAWAGVGLIPQPGAPTDDPPAITAADVLAATTFSSASEGTITAGDEELAPSDIPGVAGSVVVPPRGATPDGAFLVGAARASLTPAPEHFGGTEGQWQTQGCTSIDEGHLDDDHVVPDPAEPKGWPAASPDCIYLGGFGIGPARPATAVGHGGVWVRSIAISNGEQTFVYAVADAVGWFARYDSSVCSDCGILDVRQRLAAELGDSVDVGDVIVGSTHTHAGPDTYGGWGGIPDWYRNQIRDATIASAKQAVVNMVPATLSVGEAHLRQRNNQRRDTYFSTTDTGATWVQAIALADEGDEQEQGKGQGPPDDVCDERVEAGQPLAPCPPPEPGVIASWATFAGHPTIVGDAILHADWPGAAARRFEALHGGVGVVFEGGLGNVSISGGPDHPDVPHELGGDELSAERTGYAFADEVTAAMSHGTRLQSSVMRAEAREITHPAGTNPGLTTLASVGLFDREFTPATPGAGLPGTYGWSRAGQWGTTELAPPPPSPSTLRSCVTVGPTVITAAGAHRIGELAVAFAPGEIFSNIAEVVKEEADQSSVTMVLGQTNDALGYLIQSFEYDTVANAVTHYGSDGIGSAASEVAEEADGVSAEYEEVFSVDRCFGDHVLQTMLDATTALGF